MGGRTAPLLRDQLDAVRDDVVGVRALPGGPGSPLGGNTHASACAQATPLRTAGGHTLRRGARPRPETISVIYGLTAALMWGVAAVTATFAVRRAGTFITL